MKCIVIILFLASTYFSNAQADTTIYGWVDSATYRETQITAVCAGGEKTWNLYLAKKLNYPKAARKQGIQGTVIIDFTISTEGMVSDVKVFKSVEKSLDDEAIRLIENCRWIPAIQNGRTVNFRKRQEVEFRIE
ncbi:MAG TPA: energy transducer TonB [Chitinophagaceae bacterium]|nr:energy transducer TonB [Chitinophagaceae bacterium]